MRQIIYGGNVDALNNAADEYCFIQGGNMTSAWNAGWGIRSMKVSAAGTFKNLHVELSAAPTTQPYRIEIYNGGGVGGTGVYVDIAVGNTTGDSGVTTWVAAPGDSVCLSSSRPSGNPGNTPTVKWSLEFEGTTDGQALILTAGQCGAGSTVCYCPLMNPFMGYGTTEARLRNVIPTNGTISKMYVTMSGTIGGDITFTVKKNGGDTSLAVTIASGGTSGSDTADSVSVAAGDYIHIKMAPTTTSSVANAAIGFLWTPDTNGESIIMGCSSNASPNNAAVSYNALCGNLAQAWDATEANKQYSGQSASVIKKLYVQVQTAPGAGKSWDFTLRGSGGSTSLTVPIAEAVVSNNDSVNSYTVLDWDDLAILATPTATPTATGDYCAWSVVSYIAPPATGLMNIIPLGFIH